MTEREFIGREQQFPPSSARVSGESLEAAKAKRGVSAAPLGEPPQDFGVRSVYDVRPVNAFDFNVTLGPVVVSEEDAFDPVNFAVPDGFVGVLREVHYWSQSPVPDVERTDIALSIQLNKVDYTLNTEIPVGSGTGANPITCFVVADQGQLLGVRFSIPGTLLTPFDAFVLLYGNLLPKTECPANYQIANAMGK